MSAAGEHGTFMRRAAYASVGVSLFLVAIKTFAYFTSHSVAMLASMADSALDLFTAALNFFAIHEALAPADKEHRFGHGKAEPLAGLAQGAFITASAIFLVIQAAQRLLNPQPIDHGLGALIVMLVSIAFGDRADPLSAQRDAAARARWRSRPTKPIISAISPPISAWCSPFCCRYGPGLAAADPIVALFVAAVLVASAWLVFRQMPGPADGS